MPNQTKQEGKCYGCGAKDHYANNPKCPNYKPQPVERIQAARSVVGVDGVDIQ